MTVLAHLHNYEKKYENNFIPIKGYHKGKTHHGLSKGLNMNLIYLIREKKLATTRTNSKTVVD